MESKTLNKLREYKTGRRDSDHEERGWRRVDEEHAEGREHGADRRAGEDGRTENKANKRETGFNEMVTVVQGIRGSTLRRPRKIGWRPQSKRSEHPESARRSAEIWFQSAYTFICRLVSYMFLLIHLKTHLEPED